MKINFTPNLKDLKIPLDIRVHSHEEFKYEPMFFQSSLKFVLNNAPSHYSITRYILAHMLLDYNSFLPILDDIIIDSRITMTMNGQYPSIPGWHCDHVPRGANGQPDFSLVDPKIFHRMIVVSGSESVVSCTEFVTEPVSIDVDPDNVWNSVDKYCNSNNVKKEKIEQGKIYQFDQMTIHRATACETPGWRMFLRASFNCKSKPVNEIRKQVQVYTPIDNNGW
jgi:hypothetical protein